MPLTDTSFLEELHSRLPPPMPILSITQRESLVQKNRKKSKKDIIIKKRKEREKKDTPNALSCRALVFVLTKVEKHKGEERIEHFKNNIKFLSSLQISVGSLYRIEATRRYIASLHTLQQPLPTARLSIFF